MKRSIERDRARARYRKILTAQHALERAAYSVNSMASFADRVRLIESALEFAAAVDGESTAAAHIIQAMKKAAAS